MKVILANPRGFCAGVLRAVSTVEHALQLYGPPLYVFHEIVHNTHVVQRLRDRGAVFVDSVSEVPDGSTLVFSAHGVSPAVRQQAEQRRLRIIDATCPLVTKVHKEARRFAKRDFHIVLIGHADHDEIVGTVGEAPASIQVVSNVREVDHLDLPTNASIAYLTQTTLSLDDVANIIVRLQQRFPRLVGPAKSDICYATQNRQEAVNRLAPTADFVLVVGSKNSSNCNRLCDVARAAGVSTRLVDHHSEIQCQWFNGQENVLVTAGASVPEEAVSGVIQRLQEMFQAEVTEEPGVVEHEVFPLPEELMFAKKRLAAPSHETTCTT